MFSLILKFIPYYMFVMMGYIINSFSFLKIMMTQILINHSCYLRKLKSPSCEGPLEIPLQSVQVHRASSPFEVGTSGFLSSADMDLRDPMELQQGSQALFHVETWNSASLFRCKRVIRLPVELALGSGAFSQAAPGLSHLPLCSEWILMVPVEAVQGNQAYLEWMGNSGSFWIEARLPGMCLSFKVRLAFSWGVTATSGFLSRWSRGINIHLELRRVKTRLFLSCGVKLSVPLRGGRVSSGPFWVASRVSSTLLHFRRESGICLETLLWNWASSRVEGRISWFFSSCGRKLGVPLKLRWGPQGPAHVASEKLGLFSSCEGHVGIPLKSLPVNRAVSRVQSGNSVFLSGSDRDLGLFIKVQLGSQASSGVEAWNSAFLSSCPRGFSALGEFRWGIWAFSRGSAG